MKGSKQMVGIALINFTQLLNRNPILTFTGDEIIPTEADGNTGATTFSALEAAIQNNIDIQVGVEDIVGASAVGKQILSSANASSARTAIGAAAAQAGPVTLTANTTLSGTAHANRRVMVTQSGITLTAGRTGTTNSDEFRIYNLSNSSITLQGAAGEMFRSTDSAEDSSTVTIGTRKVIRLFIIDATTWFVEK